MTPDKVTVGEPIIDTILMMIAVAGNSQKMTNPSACVAIIKSTVIAFINNTNQ